MTFAPLISLIDFFGCDFAFVFCFLLLRRYLREFGMCSEEGYVERGVN